MSHEFRGRGFDSGFAPSAPQRRQQDPTPAERAQTAVNIASNLERAHVTAVESIGALGRAHDARDVAGYAVARRSAESAVERVRELANGAMALAADASDAQVRAKLEQAAALADVATRNLAAAPVAPEPVAPTLRNESALLAALPPAEINGPTKFVFDAARQSTRSALLQMPYSDYGALERILAEFPAHEVAVRFRKFKTETQGELRAILKDPKTRVRARSIEASMPKLAPPPPAFTAPSAVGLIAPPPAFDTQPATEISDSPTATMQAGRSEQPQKLPKGIRGELEQATGRSLDHVRVHAGNDGATVAAQHGARAVAIGHEIHMGEGQLDPASGEGRELIAHEVGHVLQADARPGSTSIAAKRDSAGDENAAEADADQFAAMFRAGGGSAKWEPSVSVSGAAPLRAPATGQSARTTESVGKTSEPTPIVRVDQKATTKSYAREYVTSDEFLSLWATELLDVTMKNLGPTPAQPHARLRWMDAANTLALISSNLDSSRGRFAADDRGLLLRLFYPMDLHALVDRYRDLRPSPPGHEAQGPLGTSAWQTSIGDSIAAEARPRLQEAIHRMGQRYVAAADALHASGTRAEQAIKEKLAAESAILPHTPLDYIVLLAMRDPNAVTYTPPNAKAPREFANNELRPLSIKCMGEQDDTLWNVIRVDTAGATVEQVAAVLFNRGDDATAHSYNADLIVDAAPFYILPKEWAATLQRIGGQLGPAAYEPKDEKKQRELDHYNPEAARRAAAQAGPDPRTVLAESTLADDIALAQNDLVTQRQAAEKPADKKARAGKDDANETMLSVDAEKLIVRGRGQLAYLREVMTPWSLGKSLTTADEFLMRMQEKTRRSDVLNASWSSLLARHGHLLSEVSESTASFIREVGKPAIAGGDPETPVGQVLAKYARAAGAAHQVGSGPALLADAEQARQGVLLATIELAVQSSGYAVSQERASEDHARDVNIHALKLDDSQKSIRMSAAQMRNALAQGKGIDARAAEELILEAEENRLVASLSTLQVQLAEFKSEADKGTIGIIPGFVQSTELLNMRLDAPFLIAELEKIHGYLMSGHGIIYGPRDPKDAADPSLPDVPTRKLQNLQKYVRGTHDQLEALKQNQHIEQFLQRADKVLADQRWRVMIGTAAAMIGVGLVTGGVASFVGGAVRGAMLLDLGADAAGLVRTVRMARAFGTAAELATDATLSGVAQHALTGGDTAIGENIISNALTRFALSPLGRLTSGLGEVDKKALDAWQRVGNAGQFVLGKGIQLSAEMLTGTAIGYAVHRIAAWKRGEQPSDEMVDSWLLQGASFAVGRFLNGQLHHRMAQLEKFGQRVGRLPQRMRVLADRAARLERTGTPDEALDLLIEHRSIVDEEIATIARLEHDGTLRPNEAKALRSDAYADSQVIKGQGFTTIQAHAVGLEPVVAAAGRWAGDSEQIANMIFKGRALGLDIHIVEVGNQTKKWRVKYGDELLEIDERAPKPVVGGDRAGGRGGRQVSVHEDVRAILHAKAAHELAQIHVTVAQTENASRGYLVTREDGRRMVELFADMEGVQTIEYKNGVIVRAEGSEWYFEFRDDAHVRTNAQASGMQRANDARNPNVAAVADAKYGLPDPNVATVEIYGYSGLRSINGRKLSKEEIAAMQTEINEEDPLLLAGHVAISFDGGKTVYGFTPKPDPSIPVEDVVEMLRNGKIFPGQVLPDNIHYERAAKKLAEHGWDTHLTRVVVTFDPNEAPVIAARTDGEMAANQRGEHPHGYGFPKKGQSPAECDANCATWLRFVGVPIPESTGRMSEYMPALKEWAAADAPIAGGRSEKTP